jgi:dolichol-phosphate mannosyltransferase
VGIESRTGFEIGIELTARATRIRRPVAEIPTIWLDRQLGQSRFDVGRIPPSYLRRYFFALGPRLTAKELAARWVEKRPAVLPAQDFDKAR